MIGHSEDTQHNEPSIVTSLGRVVETGQRLVVNRIDLLKFDLVELVTRSLQGGVMVAAGAVVLAIGWLAITWSAILFGQRYLTLPASAALAGLTNAVVGAGLIALGLQRARQHQPENHPHAHTTNGGNTR